MTGNLTTSDIYRLMDVWARCPLQVRRGDGKLVRLGYLEREDYKLGEAMPKRHIYQANGSLLPELAEMAGFAVR